MAGLQKKIEEECPLAMLTRADVRLGTNSAKTDSDQCSLEVVQVFPFVVREFKSPEDDRPNPRLAICLSSEDDGGGICPIRSPTDIITGSLGNHFLGNLRCSRVLVMLGSTAKPTTEKAQREGDRGGEMVRLTFSKCVSLLDEAETFFGLEIHCNLED